MSSRSATPSAAGASSRAALARLDPSLVVAVQVSLLPGVLLHRRRALQAGNVPGDEELLIRREIWLGVFRVASLPRPRGALRDEMVARDDELFGVTTPFSTKALVVRVDMTDSATPLYAVCTLCLKLSTMDMPARRSDATRNIPGNAREAGDEAPRGGRGVLLTRIRTKGAPVNDATARGNQSARARESVRARERVEKRDVVVARQTSCA